MRLLLTSQLRFAWRTRGSLFSALLGITLGVASIVGVHLLSARIESQIQRQSQPVGAVDLFLQRDGLTLADYFQLRRAWRGGEVAPVAALIPLVEGRIRVGSQDLVLVGSDPLAALGGSTGAPSVGPLADRRQAEWPKYLTSDVVLAPPALVDQEALRIGTQDAPIIGSSGLDGVVLADLPTAQRLLGRGEELTSIGVRLRAQPSFESAFRGLLNALLPGAIPAAEPPKIAGLDASWRQVPAAAASPVLELSRSVLFNIAALSLLALAVAWLLTFQVAQHALERRAAMFERLHGLGVQTRTLRRFTLAEGAATGLLASVLGALCGSWIANGLFAVTLGAAPEPPLALDAWVWGKACLSGFGVGVLSYSLALRGAGWWGGAAARSGSVGLPGHPRPSGPSPIWLIPLALAVGVGVFGPTGLPGGFLAILACCLLVIVYLPTALQVGWRMTSGRSVRPMRLLPARQLLAGRELRLGISALALAVATALGIGIMVDSFRNAFVELLERRLMDDVAVELAVAETALPPEVAPWVSSMFWRGKQDIHCFGIAGDLLFGDDDSELLRRMGTPPGGGALTVPEGGLAEGVYLSESFARFHGVGIGSQISIQGPAARATLPIVGLFSDYGETRPRLLASRATARHLGGSADFSEVLLTSENPTELKQVLRNLQLVFNDQEVVRARALDIFESTFSITQALTLLALLVATVALGNALAAQNLQLRASERLLAALGVTVGEMRQQRLWRALLAGGAALLVAVPLGLVIAWLLCNVVNPRAFGWQFPLHLGLRGLGWPLIGGVCAALLSPWLAGRVGGNQTDVWASRGATA